MKALVYSHLSTLKKYTHNNLWGLPPLKKFTVIPQGWRKLFKPSGRKLSDRVLQTLWTLVRMAQYNKSDHILFEYSFLEKQCGFGCSRDQIKRYLKDLVEAQVIEYSIEKQHYNCQKKLSLKIHFSFLRSQLSSGKEVNSSVHVCPAEMHTYIIDKNNIEESNKDSSTIIDININRDNKMSANFEKEIEIDSSGACAPATILSFTTKSEGEEFKTMTNQAIKETIVANLPQDLQITVEKTYEFEKLAIDKLGIRINNVSVSKEGSITLSLLTDTQKETLRSIIRKLWGNISIVLLNNGSSNILKTLRSKFDRLIMEYYTKEVKNAKIGEYMLKFHFNLFVTDPASTPEKIILKGEPADYYGVVDDVNRVRAIEHAAKQMEIEIHDASNRERPHFISKDKTRIN